MVYLNNIPMASDNLDFSQGQLQANFSALDSIYGTDHVAYSVATNSGFHNQVTTPPQGSIPASMANALLYCYQTSSALGPLQYSRAPTSGGGAVPTPVTSVQSSATGLSISNGGSISILDFSGLNAIAEFYVTAEFATSPVTYSVGSATIAYGVGGFKGLTGRVGLMTLTSSGSVLSLANNVVGQAASNVYWTLKFLRTT